MNVQTRHRAPATTLSFESSNLILFLIKVVLAAHIVQNPAALATAFLGIKIRQYHALSVLPLPVREA